MTPQDLFEHYETLPQNIQTLINDFNTRTADYNLCNRFVEQLEERGYTCEFGLDAIPFNLTVF